MWVSQKKFNELAQSVREGEIKQKDLKDEVDALREKLYGRVPAKDNPFSAGLNYSMSQYIRDIIDPPKPGRLADIESMIGKLAEKVGYKWREEIEETKDFVKIADIKKKEGK